VALSRPEVNVGYILVPFVLGAAVVAVATPVLMRIARRHGYYDKADGRKIHPAGISPLGGIALFIGMASAGLAAMLWGSHPFSGRLAVAFALGFTPIFAVSVWDDLHPLPWWLRLLVQAAGAVLFTIVQDPIGRLNLPFLGEVHPGWWSHVLVVGWLLLTTNALNFIDGLDGLAAGVAAIAGVALLISACGGGFVAPVALAASLVGVCVGFLPYNFPPARIFMGDSGATLLGYVLGVMALVGAGKNVALVSLLLPLLVLGVPIADAIVAIARRTYRGRRIFEADREHVHHRLLSLGLGYRRTVLLLYMVTALLGGLGLFLATGPRVSVVFVVVLAAACSVLLFKRGAGGGPNPPSGGGEQCD
jgi:UDP-GlcNAc:undecaprenyl-phosphate GlcNAc-1-phosphate transferase